MRFPAFFGCFFGVDVGHIKLFSIGCARKRPFGLSGVTSYGHGTYVADGFFGRASSLKRAFQARFCRRRAQNETCASQEATTQFIAETGVVSERCVSAPFAIAVLRAKPVSRRMSLDSLLQKRHWNAFTYIGM